MSELTELQAKKIQEYIADEYDTVIPVAGIAGVLNAFQTLPALETNVAHPATPENIERIGRDAEVPSCSTDVVVFHKKGWNAGYCDEMEWRDMRNNIIRDVTHFMIPEVK